MIVETARAKLNLALHVRRRRDDGYHEIETLFAFVADGDELRVAAADEPRFVVTGPFAAALGGGGDNLVTRAIAAFGGGFGTVPPLAVELVKTLPVASGIGGGSADAAAMLRVLARRAGIALDDRRLTGVAADLGSDVPACLLGATAIGRGRGEELVPVEGLPGTPALLVNPGVAVSTARVFAAWDGVDRGPLDEGRLLGVAKAGRNDLARAAIELAPAIATVLAALERQPGVLLARMSGSGATCFALFGSAAERTAAARAMAGWWCLETALA